MPPSRQQYRWNRPPVVRAWDRLALPPRSRRSGLRNEVLKIIKEPLLKAWHTVRMMAALFVLDNFKVGVDRQQTAGVFIPKSCSELFFASNKLCWTQERSLS
jgi:hypothetical protein